MRTVHQPGDILYAGYDAYEGLPVSHGVGPDRHIEVSCRCGRTTTWDAAFVFGRGLGGRSVSEVQKRLKCTCGTIGAKITMVYGPAPEASR